MSTSRISTLILSMSGFSDGSSESDSSDESGSSAEPEHMDSDNSAERDIQDIVENVRMTDKHKAFLRCIYDYDGKASISKIKDKTGLNQDEAHSRFRKWSSEEFNLIDIEKLSAEESGKPTGERVAVLNERGEAAIQQGLIGDVFDEEEKEVRKVFGDAEVEDFEDLQEEVDRLANMVERLQAEVDAQEGQNEGVREKVDELEDNILSAVDKVSDLEERVERAESEQGLDELDGVKGQVSQLETRVDDVEEDVSSLRESFEEFRASVRKHLLEAEAHMKGILWTFDEEGEFELPFKKYINRVRGKQDREE